MTQTPGPFRSKRDREMEIDLVQKYRQIGIGAIAAASQACRPTPANTDIRRSASAQAE